jgi:putative ABC transport system ATP-binding protein
MLPLLYNGQNHLSDTQCHDWAIAALESVGLGDRVEHRPNELSGGQQQRVAIARALVNEPSILLADEPTGNLDTTSSLEILELLHQLHDSGATIVMVTHEPGIAEHAERVIFLRDGLVVSDKLNGKRRSKFFLNRDSRSETGDASPGTGDVESAAQSAESMDPPIRESLARAERA